MPDQGSHFIKQIKKWVINDYFTPNIKAEVILDMLLTLYVVEMRRLRTKKLALVQADLPEEDGMLAEWGEALHKLDEKDVAAIGKLFYRVVWDPMDLSRMAFQTPVPYTLKELLDNAGMKN